MYEAKRWNNDPRCQAPMTTLPNGDRMFVYDFVTLPDVSGKLIKLIVEVWLYHF